MEFNYYGEDFVKFEKSFNELYTGLQPLTFITDDLLKSMSVDRPYFVMPPQITKDGRRYLFKFDVVGDKYLYNSRNNL